MPTYDKIFFFYFLFLFSLPGLYIRLMAFGKSRILLQYRYTAKYY
jgi:hypothetical protein